MASEHIRLGAVQLSVMRVLWRRGTATAREITDALSQKRPVAHSTVQTLLRQLEAKGAVRHEAQGRTFVYAPVVSEAEAVRGAARDLVRRLFDGSPAGLVAHVLRHERLSPRELAQIRKLIRQQERKP